MNYERYWAILEELLLKLREKGFYLPPEITEDLKTARTLITILQTNPSVSAIETEIMSYMEKVEPILLSCAERGIGKEYADSWQRKAADALAEIEKTTPFKTRFVAGVPKNEDWLRLDTKDIMGEKDLALLLNQFQLSNKSQDDGYLLVHGEKENLKAFVREIRKKIAKAS
jgi:hypothetical protein